MRKVERIWGTMDWSDSSHQREVTEGVLESISKRVKDKKENWEWAGGGLGELGKTSPGEKLGWDRSTLGVGRGGMAKFP